MKLKPLSFAAIVLALTPLFAPAQDDPAPPNRAANGAARKGRLVTNNSVDPHWAADGNSFFYLTDGPNGDKVPWLVNALTGTRRPATDEERKAIGNPTLPKLPHEEPTRNSGGEATIHYENRTGAAVSLIWINPKGEHISYGEIPPDRPYESNTYAGHVWLIVDAAGKTLGIYRAVEGDADVVIEPANLKEANRKRPPATPPPPDAEPDPDAANPTSPDGRWRADIREGNVFIRDLQTGDRFQLSTDAKDGEWYDNQFHWSPDSTHLVATHTVDGDHRMVYEVQSSPPDQLQPKLLSFEYAKPGDKIAITQPRLFDIATHNGVPIDDSLFNNPWDGGDDHIRWDADSQRFTFYYNQRGSQAARVIAVDAKTGAAKAVVDEQTKTFIDYSGKMYLKFIDDSELVWMSERDGWNHLFLYDAKTGQVKNTITAGKWVVRSVDRIDAKARQVWFQAGGINPKQDPYYVHYCRVNLDGTGLVDLTPDDGTHSIKWSPDGRFYIDTFSRVDLPPVTQLRRRSDGSLICPLEKGDASALLATGWRYPERFVAKGRDGTTDIYGIIVRPLNFDPNKKYPVIEDIYAGPHGAAVPKSFERSATAEPGFIVVHIDGMGTNFRSKAFHDVCWHNIGDAGFPDRILWIKAAAAKHSEIDLSRGVGIAGTSAGGQNALRALEAYGDFYTAAVADCGCHDNRMDKIWWNEQWMGWPIGPWYDEQSNVTNAKNLKGSLMLIVGELDHNVDPSSTMQVVNALIKADKDFDLLVIPNADHGEDGAYGNRRRSDFFIRHLLGIEPRKQ